MVNILTMSFLFDQPINGKVYVYRIENYWDKEGKVQKQRREYVGRRDEKTGDIIPKKIKKNPIHSLSDGSDDKAVNVSDMGPIWLLKHISDRIGLPEVLHEVFPELAQDFLGLAFYQTCESKPLYLYQDWLSTVSLNGYAFSSQEISDLCEALGSQEGKIIQFFESWIRRQLNPAISSLAQSSPPNVPSLYLDITSLSTFGKHNDFAEWGYNRDKEPLPQVNLGMVIHEATNLPLVYRMLPGSIPDVSSLKTTLAFLKDMGTTPTRFVLDRGFYSQRNLLEMKQANISFLIPVTVSSRLASSLFAQAGENLLSPSHAFSFQHSVIFHQMIPLELSEESESIQGMEQEEVVVTTNQQASSNQTDSIQTKNTKRGRGKPPSEQFLPPVSCIAHLYFDETRRAQEVESFYQQLIRVEDIIHRNLFRSLSAVKQEIEEMAPRWSKFWDIQWDCQDHSVKLTRKDQTIHYRTHHFGKMVLLSSAPYVDKEEALLIYRRRDAIEKLFDTQKNELNQSRIRVHTRTSMMGRLFLSFLAIILYCALLQQLKETKLHKKFTVPEILMILRSIRKITRKDGSCYYTEITKKQRLILDAFEIPYP